ncbi:hypothetical protein EI534_03975 [Pseudomonas frederiksbergensis]|nr:hypothetical protein [Pseudomonas frederiksbergensis]
MKIRYFFSTWIAITLSGCTTFLSSEKAGPNTEGIEYSLPVPVVRVTPQANGTMDVKVEYLSDPDNTYVLRTRSLASSYTLDVQRQNGMLASVSLDSKSDAASSVMDSAGNLIKNRSDEKIKKEEEEQAEDATAKAALKEQVKAANEAQMEVAVAEAKLSALEAADAGTGKLADKILDAKISLAEARAKRDHFLSIASGSNASSFNAPVTEKAAAPTLFRVYPDNATGGVKLVAFDGPTSLPTSSVAKPAQKLPNLSIYVEGAAVVTQDQTLALKIHVNRPVSSVDLGKSELVDQAHGAKSRKDLIVNANASPTDKGSVITLTLKKGTPVGRYKFKPWLIGKLGEPMMPDPVTIAVTQ